MAVYVYNTVTGELFSWSPNDTDPIAPNADLVAAGLTVIAGLAPLDASHAWDPATKSVIAVTPPKSRPTLNDFWKRFTQAEREAIENLAQTGSQTSKNKVAAFFRYVSAGGVDCNDPYILTAVQMLETAGVIAPGRTAQIVV